MCEINKEDYSIDKRKYSHQEINLEKMFADQCYVQDQLFVFAVVSKSMLLDYNCLLDIYIHLVFTSGTSSF